MHAGSGGSRMRLVVVGRYKWVQVVELDARSGKVCVGSCRWEETEGGGYGMEVDACSSIGSVDMAVHGMS